MKSKLMFCLNVKKEVLLFFKIDSKLLAEHVSKVSEGIVDELRMLEDKKMSLSAIRKTFKQ